MTTTTTASTAATYPQSWDLQPIAPAPDTPDFRRWFDQYISDLKKLATRSDALPPVGTAPDLLRDWVELLAEYERIDGLSRELKSLVECYTAADAENAAHESLLAEVDGLAPWREQIATNVEFAFQALSDAEFETWVSSDPRLTRIRYFLELRRRGAAMRLPRDQELLAADLAVDGLHAWGRLYDKLSGRLKVTVVEQGRSVEKSVGQVLFDSPQRAVRANNYHLVDAAWGTIGEACAEAINHIAGTRLTTYRRLGLRDHLDAPLFFNRMSRPTLDAMWQAVTDGKGVLDAYFRRKAELLGLERLAWYDVAAPLPTLPGTSTGEEISYADGCRRIMTSFHEFTPELGQFAEHALKHRWIEAENRSGKHQGAFCTDFPVARQTRIFMTYTGSADSLSTLAHELGHAYHTWVLKEAPLFLQDYPMNLAETASTFAEAILGEAQLRQAKTSYERLCLLEGMLGDAVAFLMNIHARFLFENRFHQERARGEVSRTRLDQLMLEAQREAFRNNLADDGWNPRFWVSKLHFYITQLPFYNFPYTFGYLLSQGLYAVGRERGQDFPEQYRLFLQATGSQDAEAAVRNSLGFDLTGPEFWQKSLALIARRVDQFLEASDDVLQRLRQI